MLKAQNVTNSEGNTPTISSRRPFLSPLNRSSSEKGNVTSPSKNAESKKFEICLKLTLLKIN